MLYKGVRNPLQRENCLLHLHYQLIILDNHISSLSITMKSFLTLLPVVFLTALGSPIAEDLSKRADRGSENVSGIGAHKQAILNAGGNTLDLAIAMLEM